MQRSGEIDQVQDIGAGLVVSLTDGKPAHWNVDIPGYWEGPYTLKKIGSFVSKFCAPKAGIYRLVGLDEGEKPAVLNRACGSDHTGTLYIGCEGKNFTIRSRLSQIVRSLRPPRTYGHARIYNKEHQAGYRLRSHPLLSERFPTDKLALTWCYVDAENCKLAEGLLLDSYFAAFGDTPPLNWRKS